MAAVRAGDDRAFEQLYTRYHRRIASYILGMVHDHGRAEDVAQDVFMSALRRMRETDRPIAFKPWLYEIAKNACIDQFRRSRRTEEVSFDAEAGLAASDHGRLTSRGPSPDVAVEHKQQLDHLRGAFGGLSDAHHEILVMREFEGLSYREIGERLGMSRPSVESTLFRARRRLTEEYEELVTGERCLRVQAIVRTAAEGDLGARDRRRLGRHISHCQPCRRHARLAGLDTAELAERLPRARLAALLPLPAFLRRRDGAEDGISSSMAAGAHPLAQWSTAVAHYVEPGIAGWAKAAAAAATIAAAGTGVNATVGDAGLRIGTGVTDSVLMRSAPDDASSSGVVRRTVAPAVVLPANSGTREARAPSAGRPPGTPTWAERRRGATTGKGQANAPGVATTTPPPVAPPPVDDASIKGLIPSTPTTSPTPRPPSGGDRGTVIPQELVPKDSAAATGPGELPVAEPETIPQATVDQLPGAVDRIGAAAGDILDG